MIIKLSSIVDDDGSQGPKPSNNFPLHEPYLFLDSGYEWFGLDLLCEVAYPNYYESTLS